jgi:2,4-dienoyl-CoA reductase-like NADH-dependent reductase (Old Yellow Enzyme family)
MAAMLFEPIDLRSVRLPNRIVVAPMTQFSAPDGVAGDWHMVHLGQYATSGAALVLTESTYVASNARNARSCLSIYSDEQEAGIGRIAQFYNDHGGATFGVQLCHGGRKASAREPWDGGGPLPISEGGYEAWAPSAVPISDDWPAPTPLTSETIGDVIQAFADGAKRAHRAGARVIEIHGAHGYLIHQFLSPITNRRNDSYGGDLPNRMRFAIDVYDAIRAVWPDELPIGIRVSATDWIEGGWDVGDTVELAKALEAGSIRRRKSPLALGIRRPSPPRSRRRSTCRSSPSGRSAMRIRPKPSCAPARPI